MDALEKSNTKLTEEVSVTENHLMFWPFGLKRKERSYFQISAVRNDECLMVELEELTCQGITLAFATN